MERIENTILRNLLYNEEYARKTLPFIKEEYFSQFTEKAVFQEIKKYFEKYSNQIQHIVGGKYFKTNETKNN